MDEVEDDELSRLRARIQKIERDGFHICADGKKRDYGSLLCSRCRGIWSVPNAISTEPLRFYYRVRWPHPGVWCPLGKITVRPMIRVFAQNTETIPFREIDEWASRITDATYEEAAQRLCRSIFWQYAKQMNSRVLVRVGEPSLWADSYLPL